MLKSELFEIIANGENSGIEFKKDDIPPEQLAKEIVAMANLDGGKIIPGVEDDGTISGIQTSPERPEIQEWVLNVFRDKVHPQMIPFYEEIVLENNLRVAVVSFPQGISKPYVVRNHVRKDIYIRMGDRSELATREQQTRLYSIGGLVHAELFPVSGSSLFSLDRERITDYLMHVIGDSEG